MSRKYMPETCVWEMTTACNLHCLHCASSCSSEGRKKELSAIEILDTAKQLSQLGLKWVSLTGGEIFLSDSWYFAAQALEAQNIRVHMITNGTLLTDDKILKIKNAGVSRVVVSLDGPKEIHDFIRGEGAYEKAMEGLRKLECAGVRTGCITSVMKNNFSSLKQLKEELIKNRVSTWQIQMAVPEGNMRLNRELLLSPEQIPELIDLAYEMSRENSIRIVLPDNVGYYKRNEAYLRIVRDNEYCVWQGCNAGIRSFGILSNGDIVGCTSMRDSQFIEGNIRERSIREIWEDEDAFSWRRSLSPENLGENCSECRYAEVCLGGCSNTRYTVQGSIYSDNPYCAYAVSQNSSLAKDNT